jgi:hypothetical protein
MAEDSIDDAYRTIRRLRGLGGKRLSDWSVQRVEQLAPDAAGIQRAALRDWVDRNHYD